MQKRGQFTLFVVLGIVLVLAVGLFYIFREDIFAGFSEELSYPSEVSEVVDHVQECVDESAYFTVLDIGRTGGYFSLPRLSFSDEETGISVPYYYYNGSDERPSLETVQEEMQESFTVYMDACVDLTQFSSYTIEEGEKELTVLLEDDTVSFYLEYPLIVSVGESSYSLSSPYENTVVAGLGHLHSLAGEIVAYDQEHPDDVSLDFLLGLGLTKVLYVPFDNETVVYILMDNQSFAGETLLFSFAGYFPQTEGDDEDILALFALEEGLL